MSEIIIDNEEGLGLKFEEEVTAHALDGRWLELMAEGPTHSVFVRFTADEAREMGIVMMHYAFTHGAKP